MSAALLALLLGLQVGDAYTTVRVIQNGGREANPVLIWVAKVLANVTNSPWAWLVLKTIFVSCVGVFLYMNDAVVPLVLVDLGYIAVVIHNIKEMK